MKIGWLSLGVFYCGTEIAPQGLLLIEGRIKIYANILSYSACVPIQNHKIPSGFSTLSARYCKSMRTDHKFLTGSTFLKWSDGW